VTFLDIFAEEKLILKRDFKKFKRWELLIIYTNYVSRIRIHLFVNNLCVVFRVAKVAELKSWRVEGPPYEVHLHLRIESTIAGKSKEIMELFFIRERANN